MKANIFDQQLPLSKLGKIRGGMTPQTNHNGDACEQLFDPEKFDKNIGWCGSGPGVDTFGL